MCRYPSLSALPWGITEENVQMNNLVDPIFIYAYVLFIVH